MRSFTVLLVATSMAAIAQPASAKSIWDQLAESAPRAERPLDQVEMTAPRWISRTRLKCADLAHKMVESQIYAGLRQAGIRCAIGPGQRNFRLIGQVRSDSGGSAPPWQSKKEQQASRGSPYWA